MRIPAVLAVLFAALLAAAGTAAQDEIVRYEIDVRLDADEHRLHASQRIRWRNTTGVETDELWWHLYLNAFANDRTTFMRGLRGGSLRGFRPAETRWGWLRLDRLALADGTDLLPELEFVRPDDGNADDHTVARLQLPAPVPPGSAVELELAFEAQLPSIVARTGSFGDFHLVGQWYPKLGVFEGERGWNCHQFHTASEFFADFASYRVTVTVPENWVVGATGLEVERAVVGGEQRVVFAADRVHDFAWTAAPGSLMTVEEADFEPGRDVPAVWLDRTRRLLGVSAAELELPPMQLRFVVPRSQLALLPRMLRAARLAVAWHGLHYGAYPYPQLTIVSPPPGAGEAGGMEYPTFITTGAHRLSSIPPFSLRPWIEMVTVHEFGHQYFQGLLASNEFEQGWLDEGLNSFAENQFMEAVAADGLTADVRWPVFWARERVFHWFPWFPTAIDQRAWDFRSRYDYYRSSFTAASVVLKTLEGLLGPETFARAMRSYVERFRFRHPTGDDFFAVFEEVSGEDLGWFFDQAFRSDVEVDWAVLAVRHRRRHPAEGFVWDGGSWQQGPAADDEPSRWVAEVEVGRRGDLVGPVEVRLVFADGTTESRRWDGRDRWVRWRLPSDERLMQVVVDPDGVWAMESRRADNYWREPGDSTMLRRQLWWFADALQLLGLLHLPGS